MGWPSIPFWDRVKKTRGCWIWQGPRVGTRRLYGGHSYQGRPWRAHRLAWHLTNGPIPPGMHVLHKCDNPPCVNPSHLWLGTNQDNVDDKVAKGRQPSVPGLSVYGPYKNRDSWRLVLKTSGTRDRDSRVFDTKEKALAALERLRSSPIRCRIVGPTETADRLSEGVEEFLLFSPDRNEKHPGEKPE